MPINPTYLSKFEPGGFYHVYNRSPSGKKIFVEERNYFYFLELAAKYLVDYLEFYSYCLLPNHFHFLVQVKDENHSEFLDKEVSSKFRSFFIAYTNAVNKEYKLRGGLFSTPIRRISLDSDEYLSRLVCYIHYNPINHGICTSLNEYKFSSYVSIVNNVESIVNRDAVLNWFGNLDEFLKFHKTSPVDLKNLPFNLVSSGMTSF